MLSEQQAEMRTMKEEYQTELRKMKQEYRDEIKKLQTGAYVTSPFVYMY